MDLEIHALRIFSQVMHDGSFSAAARSLKITQPTVSQQIAKLEHVYGARLFERVGHDIVPTAAARGLHEFAEELLDRVDEFRESVLDKRKAPRGLVRYAMPETCQWTPHFKLIMSQIRQLPEIRFEIDILPSEAIVRGLIEARYDFGFVVGERLSPELRFEKFSDERYSCVAAEADFFAPFKKKEAPRLIGFPGWELFLTTWCKAHGVWDEVKPRIREPAVRIGTLAGAIHALNEGAGAAVIPTHCVASELESGRLVELRPGGKNTVAFNPVYLAKRVGDKPPRRVETVIELVRAAKKSVG